MSKTLAKLLDEPEADVSSFVFELERLSGHQGLDVRFALEIEKSTKIRIRQLGLDPQDSTPEETYHALRARFEKDNDTFTRIIGGRSNHSHSQLAPLVIGKLNQAKLPRECLAIKGSVLKSLLRAAPPKSLMKHLGYRSADSLLKREQPEEIFAGAAFTEPLRWVQAIVKQYAKLKPTDFEKRPVEIINMPVHRWENMPRKGAVVGYLPIMGAVTVWPDDSRRSNGLVLACLILQALNSTRAIASWLEFCLVDSKFGAVVTEVAQGKVRSLINLRDQSINWQSLVYHYGRSDSANLPALFEDRLNLDSLKYLEPAVALRQLDPGLRWWQGLNYIGEVVEDTVISFNLLDVSLNYSNQNSLAVSTSDWLKQSIKNELISRYVANAWVEDALLSSLDESSGGIA